MSSLSTFKEPLWKSFHDVSQNKGIYYQWVKPSSLGSKNPLFFQDLHNVDTSSSQVRMFLVEHPTTSPTIGFEWRWQVLKKLKYENQDQRFSSKGRTHQFCSQHIVLCVHQLPSLSTPKLPYYHPNQHFL